MCLVQAINFTNTIGYTRRTSVQTSRHRRIHYGGDPVRRAPQLNRSFTKKSDGKTRVGTVEPNVTAARLLLGDLPNSQPKSDLMDKSNCIINVLVLLLNLKMTHSADGYSYARRILNEMSPTPIRDQGNVFQVTVKRKSPKIGAIDK